MFVGAAQMIVSPVNYAEPLEIDDALFVHLHDCPGKHFLLANPHTFVGRISVYCESRNRTTNISLGEISSMQPESRYWLRGYFAGAEPDAPRNESGDYLPYDDPRMMEWRAAIAEFPETGLWYSGDRWCESCESKLLPTALGPRCHSCVDSGRNG